MYIVTITDPDTGKEVWIVGPFETEEAANEYRGSFLRRYPWPGADNVWVGQATDPDDTEVEEWAQEANEA